MSASISLSDLALKIGASFTGDGSMLLKGVAPLDTAKEGDLTFITNPRYAKHAGATQGSCILCDKEIPGVQKSFLLAPNPYAALARIIGVFFPKQIIEPGVHNGAWIDSSASIHPEACVFPGVYIGARAKVGRGTILYPGVFLGEDTIVGEDCIFYSNVTVREKCIVGNRVIFQPGVAIGADGFGFAPEKETYVKIPQVGNVIIEDDVELGSNTCVDRAALGSTRIGKGTKIDNLVQIGHNVVIGKNTIIVSQTGISGSTQVGDHVLMGGQVGLAGHIKIGDHVTLATRTGVMEDIPEKGVYWGSPSIDMTTEMKNVAAYRQLPALVKRVRQLEKTIEALRGGKSIEK